LATACRSKQHKTELQALAGKWRVACLCLHKLSYCGELRMSNFNKEQRYIVIKLSKLAQKKPYTGAFVGYSVEAEIEKLAGHAFVDCVVVESDWPEYEKVWKMIEKRVANTAPNTDQVALDCMKRIMYILDADWRGGEVQLKAQIQCAVIEAIKKVTE